MVTAPPALVFTIFFESATSCNALDYCELQYRIFKVASETLASERTCHPIRSITIKKIRLALEDYS